MLDLLMETVRWRGGWRCVEMECGELFMTLVNRVLVMLKSHVDNVEHVGLGGCGGTVQS